MCQRTYGFPWKVVSTIWQPDRLRGGYTRDVVAGKLVAPIGASLVGNP